MKSFQNKTAVLALTAALALTLTACGNQAPASSQTSASASSSASQSAAQSGPFSATETVDLEGNTVDSSVFAENTLTVVNVWNVGCTPCIEEIPVLDQLNKDYADRGVAVKGLYYNFGDELTEEVRNEIDEILTNAKAEYPQLLTSEDMMASDELAFIAAFPTTFFVDAQGNIVNSVMGSHDYEGWASIIDEVLSQVEANA